MNLSPHLTVEEFLSTQHRSLIEEQHRIWASTPQLQENAQRFAITCFEGVRHYTGPLHVNSGYRCPALNLAVGGVPDSRHMHALAADVVPITMGLSDAFAKIVEALKAGWLPDVDKAIIECGTWIHVQGALPGQTPRRLALVTDDTKTFRSA